MNAANSYQNSLMSLSMLPIIHCFFYSKQINRGCSLEISANYHTEDERKKHADFTVQDSGLIINSQWPFIGANKP